MNRTLLNISRVRKQGENDFVLKDIGFSQQKLQKIAIIGETGSGKSTLLKIIAGLEQPDSGEVWFEGHPVEGPSERLVPGHSGISYLSQHFELPKFLRVEQVLEYANTLSGRKATHLYDVCRITHLLKRKTDQLSGGEKQRIAIARLLISSPRLLLLDEPFSNLDMIYKSTLKAIIRDIGERLKITCILVSHDPSDTLPWADELLVMRTGQILQQGSPAEIYRKPVDEYVAGLLGKYTRLNAAQSRAFTKLNGKTIPANSMVRPEEFRIVKAGGRGVKGKVSEVSFFGSHYEIEAIVMEKTITIQAERFSMAKGDTVYVSLAPAYIGSVKKK